MDTMKNGFGMLIACSVMVIVILVQSILFFRLGRKRAKELGIPNNVIKDSAVAAAVTAVGPTLSMAIVILSLVAVVGGPMAWMRLNDIGAARTELSVISMVEGILPENYTEADYFTFASWGMALNNVGWMAVSLFLTPNMGRAVDAMNNKFNPKAVKLVMSAAALALFAYLWGNAVIGKATPYYVAAGVSAVAILVIKKLFGKRKRIQELSYGIAMIIGMIGGSVAQALIG